MGLDSFKTSDSKRGGVSKQRSINQQQDAPSEEDEEPSEEEQAFKVVGSGSTKKIFHTEEDWNELVDYIEDEMNLDIGEVLNMKDSNRHQLLHRAVLGLNGTENASFHLTRSCVVCDYTFVFPKDWSFDEVEGEPVCKEHTIREANEAVEEINSLHG